MIVPLETVSHFYAFEMLTCMLDFLVRTVFESSVNDFGSHANHVCRCFLFFKKIHFFSKIAKWYI